MGIIKDEWISSYDYYKNKKQNRTYISKRLEAKSLLTWDVKTYRIVSKPLKSEIDVEDYVYRGEERLRITPSGWQEIIAKVYEDSKWLFVLTIKRYGKGSNKEHHFSFIANEIKTLRNFLDSIKYLDFSDPSNAKVEDEALEQAKDALLNANNLDFLIDIVQTKVTKQDVVALAYRKQELEDFRKLLEDRDFFEDRKIKLNKGSEAVRQDFFERNPWIFWYGLWFVFNEPLKWKKLEQVVCGADVTTVGKRTDGIMKTKWVINAFCLVEIKHHETELLSSKLYRPWTWNPSYDLIGWVAQSQKTVQKTLENIKTYYKWFDDNWDPTGEYIYNYLPKSYLIIGNLKEFMTSNWVNQEKYSSFELFRKNIHNPEIITFDELYERAKFIVDANSSIQMLNLEDNDLPL